MTDTIWTVTHDQRTGITVGVPRSLIAPQFADGSTYYTGTGGVFLELRQFPGQIDAVRASVTETGLSADARKVNYRLDKPDRQVISLDAANDSTIYLRFDRVGNEWKGFRLKISHDTAGIGSLITAFSADFDATGGYPIQADQGSLPQLFSLLSEAKRNAPAPPVAMAIAQSLARTPSSPGPIQQASSEAKPQEQQQVVQPQIPAPPTRQPTQAMTAVIQGGALADLLILANTAPDAPNAAVGLSGELTFLSGHGAFCNGPGAGSDYDDNLATTDWFAGRKLPHFSAQTVCRSSTLDNLDGVLVYRSSIQDLQPRLYNDIAQRLHVGTSEAFVIVPETERKKAREQQAQARLETQQFVSAGHLGFGYAAIANTSGAACVVSDPLQGQVWNLLLSQRQKEISLDLGRSIQTQAVLSDADTAYIAGRRGNCGIVIATAEQLKSMFKAFERDHVVGIYGSVWFTPESIEKVADAIETGSASAEQLAEKTRQQSQQQQELRTRREETEGVTRAQKTQQLRATYEAGATAMRDDVGPKALSLFKETIPGQQSRWAAEAFPPVMKEAAKRRAEGWEFADGGYEVVDYGRSDWSGRTLETGVVRVRIKLKNADIGRYDDLCLNLAYQYDAEFKRIRSPQPIDCDAPDELSRWLRRLNFDSQWNAP